MILIKVFFLYPLLLSDLIAAEFRTFSQRYSGINIDLLTPSQLEGFEVVLSILKTKYSDVNMQDNVHIEWKVLDQHLTYESKRQLASNKIRSSRKRDLNVFSQNRFLDIDFTMYWSAQNDNQDLPSYQDSFMSFMNSEMGALATQGYMNELGIPIEEVYPLRVIDSSSVLKASAFPPLELNPTLEPSLVIERFSLTLEGSTVAAFSEEQIKAFEVFLELFTASYGASGGEPLISTNCEIISQDLSLTLLRRNLMDSFRNIIFSESRNLSNLKYYLDVKFSMAWSSSDPTINIITENYLEDFIGFMNSDIGRSSLQSKLQAVGMIVEEISTIRLIGF